MSTRHRKILMLSMGMVLASGLFFRVSASARQWEFNVPDEIKGWNLIGLDNKGITNGAVKLEATTGAPQMYSPDIEVDAAAYRYVVFRMKLAKGIVSGGCLLFITDSQPEWNDNTVVSFQCQSDGEFHAYEVDMSKNPLWKGTVLKLRFHPFYAQWPIPEEQRVVEIDYLRVVSEQELPKRISQWEFNNYEGKDGWFLWSIEDEGVEGGIWKLKATVGTPQLYTPKMEINADNQQAVVFRMKLAKGIVSGGCLLFITDSQPEWNDNTVVSFQCQSDGEFHTYEVDMSKNALWKGKVLQLRFHPIYIANNMLTEETSAIEIDYFQVPSFDEVQKGETVTAEMPELIENGGLESIAKNGDPDGWKKFCEDPLSIDVSELRKFGNPSNSLVSRESHTGKNSIWVNIPGIKEEIGGWATRADMKPKTIYQFSCWAKITGKPAVVAINEFMPDGTTRTIQNTCTIASDQWEKYSMEFESDSKTAGVQIAVSIWVSTGQAWFDDFSLREADLSGKTSAGMLVDETPFTSLTREVVTPHIPWAVPFAAEPIKVLAIPRHREIVELSQRLSIDYSTWSKFEDADKFPGNEVMDFIYYGSHNRGMVSSLAELKAKLGEKNDVILIAGPQRRKNDWQTLPESLKSDMLKKVKEGAGLIFIRPSKETRLERFMEKPVGIPAYLSAGIPFEGLTVLDRDVKGQEWLKCFTCGQGRVVIVDYQNENLGTFEVEKEWFKGADSPFTPDITHDYRAKPLYYEYYQSLLAKLVVWTAQKEGKISLAKLSFDNGNLLARISNAGPAQTGITAEVTVRDSDGTVEATSHKPLDIREGETDFNQKIARLKSGPHFADLWLKRDGKTLVWGSTYFQTKSDIEIVAIVTNKVFYKPGETVAGKVSFNKELPDFVKVSLQFSDSLGRILEKKEISASGKKEVPFQTSLLNPAAIYHSVKISLRDGNGILSEKAVGVICRRRPQKIDDFQFWFWANMWVDNNDLLSRYMLKDLYDRGFDVAYCYKPQFISHEQVNGILLNTVKSNLEPALFITGAIACSGGGYDSADIVRPRCFTSKQFRDPLFHILQDQTSVARNYPVHAYSLGDENGIGLNQQDFCFSATCQEYIRNYLKSIYGNIGKLNEEWGTGFTGWEQVKCMTMAEAKAYGNFAPWADLRMAMEDMFANLVKECRETIRKEDPNARVGSEGPTSNTMYKDNGEDSFLGYDFGKIIPQGNFWGVYFQHYPQIEYLRSFALPDTIRQTFTQPFEDYPGGYFEDKWQNEKVNRFVPWYDLFHGMNSTQYWDAMDTKWHGFYSHDLRFTPWAKQIVETIQEIKAGTGKLLLKSHRENYGIAIHYSPASFHAQTILGGRERVESPRAFCHLIEDLGLQYSFISKEQMEQGRLADYKVLILPYSRAVSTQEAAAIKTFAAGGGFVIADGEAGVMDGHCKYVKQNMLSGVKIVTTANPIWKYREVRNAEAGSRYRGEINALLEKVGIKPRFKIIPKNGTELIGCELVEFTDGLATYLGILQGREYLKKATEDHTPQPVTVALPETYHVYSVRDGRYLGFVNRVETTIEPAVAILYALLPCEVKSLVVEKILREYVPGTEVKYSVRAVTVPDITIPRVVHLEVVAPGGKLYKEYGRNLSLLEGMGEGSFTLALNDPAGIWKIAVTDVATKTKTERTFTVIRRKE